MYLLRLALASLLNRRATALLTVLAIALSSCLLLTVERVNSNFYLGGAKIWRMLATGDATQLDGSLKAIDTATADLKELIDHENPSISSSFLTPADCT